MIGERLKETRQKRGIKQRELAEVIGVQTSMISRYETDRDDPTDRIKILIAQHLNISLDFLLGVIDIPVSYYGEERFLYLDEGLLHDERFLMREYYGYLIYRRSIPSGI